MTLCILILGIGAIIGAFICGFLSDKYPLKKIGLFGLSYYIFVLFLTFLSLYFKDLNLTYITSFNIGFINLFLSNWLQVTCSKIYHGNLGSFSVNKQAGTISFVLYQILIALLTDKINMIDRMYI